MSDETPGKVHVPRSQRRGASANKPTALTPLWILSLFLSLAEVVVGTAAVRTDGGVQSALVAFAIAFPLLVAIAFFAILWVKPWAFYHPAEYGDMDIAHFVGALTGAATLVRSTSDTEKDTKVFGKPDHFRLLFKAQGRGWKKSTKAMELPDGCLVQVTTEQESRDGLRVAEALSFVPNVVVAGNGSAEEGRHLAAPPKAEAS